MNTKELIERINEVIGQHFNRYFKAQEIKPTQNEWSALRRKFKKLAIDFAENQPLNIDKKYDENGIPVKIVTADQEPDILDYVDTDDNITGSVDKNVYEEDLNAWRIAFHKSNNTPTLRQLTTKPKAGVVFQMECEILSLRKERAQEKEEMKRLKAEIARTDKFMHEQFMRHDYREMLSVWERFKAESNLVENDREE